VLRTDGLLPAVEHGSEWMKSSELPSPGEAVDRRMAKQGGASVPRDTRKHPDQPAAFLFLRASIKAANSLRAFSSSLALMWSKFFLYRSSQVLLQNLRLERIHLSLIPLQHLPAGRPFFFTERQREVVGL